MTKPLFVFATFLIISCSNFGQLKHVADFPNTLDEVSGILFVEDSTIWAIEDGGNKDEIYKVDFNGDILKTFEVKNAKNIDWEDITKDQNGNIYIADTGNNGSDRKNLVIYKIPNPEIEKGKNEFNLLTEKGRLWIIDEPYSVDDLVDTFVYLSKRYNVGAIFIDSIQKIKTKGEHTSRQVELQRVSGRILETAKSLSVPVILGAQVDRNPQRKDKIGLEDLKEAGDIGQDAHLVLGLYTDAVEKAIEDGTNLAESALDLKVKVLKNRNGPINQEAILRFSRPLMKISE